MVKSTQYQGAMAQAFFAAEEKTANRDDAGNLKIAPALKQIQEAKEKTQWWTK